MIDGYVVRVVDTPQLMRLIDECEERGCERRVPDDFITKLDGAGNHVLVTGDLISGCTEPSRDDVVVAHIAFKFFGTAKAEPGALWYMEVPEDTWCTLPLYSDS